MNLDPDEKHRTPQQQAAEELALELGGYSPIPALDDGIDAYLTPTQSMLVADAFGLCKGLSTGMIVGSQPRIASNLMRVVEQAASAPENEENSALIRALKSIVSRAATFGLTADNSQILGQFSNRTR